MSQLLDYYEHTGGLGLEARDRRLAGSNGVQQMQLDCTRGAFPDPAVPELNLQCVTGGGPFTLSSDLGAGRFECEVGQGDFVFAPANVDCDYNAEGAFRLWATVIPTTILQDLTQSVCGGPILDFGQLHATTFRDPVLAQLVHRIWTECDSGNMHGALYADTAAYGLVTLLLANARLVDQSHLDPVRPAKIRIDRAIGLMHDRLGDDLELADLASEAAMSISAFHRAFRTQTGVSPCQYFQGLRITRAKQMLVGSSKSITEIALAVGYATPQRFSTVFREQTGTTPTHWRKTS